MVSPRTLALVTSSAAGRSYMTPAAKDDWATPQGFFNRLNGEFDFTLDPCASSSNHKCSRYYTREQNGLKQDWGCHTVFCNPPYGRAIPSWMKKADAACRNGATVVLLVPARTDTKWFHRIAVNHEVRFIEGRIKFGDGRGSAPFASILVVMRAGAAKPEVPVLTCCAA